MKRITPSTNPAVFHDASRRRWFWTRALASVGAVVALFLACIFARSLVVVPALPRLDSLSASLRRSIVPHVPHLATRTKKLQQFLLRKTRHELLAEIAMDRQGGEKKTPGSLVDQTAIVSAFYAPWQGTALNSLRANAKSLTHLFPAWLRLNATGDGIDFQDWDPRTNYHNPEVVAIARENNLRVLPVLSNANDGLFDAQRVHILFGNELLQRRLAIQLRQWLLQNHFQGLNVDFEGLTPEDSARLPGFLGILRSALAPAGLQLSADIEAGRPGEQMAAIAGPCDFVVVMAYDEHSYRTKKSGPISSIVWFQAVLRKAAAAIPSTKLVVGFANYGYDWSEAENADAEAVTFQGALLRARDGHEGQTPAEMIDFDPQALNPTFSYFDEGDNEHEVWFLDAVTAANELQVAHRFGIRGAALWVIGSEDPSLWQFFGRAQADRKLDPVALSSIHFPYDVEFVGNGEILTVAASPADGQRQLEVDPQMGLYVDEQYLRFPTSFVIRRTGYHPKTVALTIDDGPAEPYTSQMLDELKTLHVPATFFLIGQNAEAHPDLVRRIWAEGNEIGNHSFTHPNIGAVSERRASLELNATQRVIQSILGRSTLLFRPPYNADAEPTSAEEVRPIIIANQLGYLTVEESLDPQDWNLVEILPGGGTKPRTASDFLHDVLEQVDGERGSSILLHDGGGNRSETVKALPLIVHALQQRGYRFVTVSALIGSSREAIMPAVGHNDQLLLDDDRFVFNVMYIVDAFLRVAFLSAIALGTLRVLLVSILALVARRREKRRFFDETMRPAVSVVIAAFNEERVIAQTVFAVLAGGYEPLQVVVVDDGSDDSTSEVVRSRFGHDSRVRLISQPNRGKSAALNNAISHCGGEIVICLDADTQFAKDTVQKLVRRFSDPRIGAVAGNVKVGNRISLLTRWQSIEYITSQNLDRRAYAQLDSVSVVPGAVGAWRREALEQAGGYSSDTMAEDTDLTWRVRRWGWKIEAENEALAFTEAPDTVSALFKQRFRWTYGTLQCLWKHRDALGRYGWFGRFMLPAIWVFQILFQALSPIVDLEIFWTVSNVLQGWISRGVLTRDWQPLPQAVNSLSTVLFMYLFFSAVELFGSSIAFSLDKEKPRALFWLFWQRFVYRQVMYAVLLKSIVKALQGAGTSWGKLERKGTVRTTEV
ncbi:MAG: glycosyltransferase [Acidobacteriota bacterium]